MCTRRTPNKSPAEDFPFHEKSPLPDCRPKLTGKELPTNSQWSGHGYYIVPVPPNQGGNDMKELTSYNRVAGYLNKIFDLLNASYFENALSRPTITIQSTPKAYGHFSLRDDTWLSKNGATHEINIGAGTLSRPIEEVTATLLHEMVHYYNYENGIQDCSRGNTYHNRRFKEAAESRGLIVTHSDKYGWSHTSPSDSLLEFVLKYGLTDILLNRNEYTGVRITGTGTHSGAAGTTRPRTSSTRKYLCPCCGNSVRATKTVNIACLDCNQQMLEV